MSKLNVESIIFNSSILGKDMSLTVYLPEGYYNTIEFLPVLYFLHGRSGDENIMFDADINTTADRMIRNKEIKPIMIVCPRMENSRGMNSSTICKEVLDPFNRIINIGMYEDYLIKEIIPLIDRTFNTIKDRNGRFIGGASAGGYAALHNAFRHQDMFTKVGGHMPALELNLEEEDTLYFQNLENWVKYDPISIARNNSVASDIDVYLDAGDKDEGEFYEGCSILNRILKEKRINSQNYVFFGHHNVEYIKSNIEKYLKFYGC
jgi:enterochelin esterase-like enzyme